jgi:hypothetical protein
MRFFAYFGSSRNAFSEIFDAIRKPLPAQGSGLIKKRVPRSFIMFLTPIQGMRTSKRSLIFSMQSPRPGMPVERMSKELAAKHAEFSEVLGFGRRVPGERTTDPANIR